VGLVAPVLSPALGAIRAVLGQAAQPSDSNQPRQIVLIRLDPLNPIENRHPARRHHRREANGSLTQAYVCFPSTLKRPADHLAIPAPWARDPRDHSEHVRSLGARRADRGRPRLRVSSVSELERARRSSRTLMRAGYSGQTIRSGRAAFDAYDRRGVPGSPGLVTICAETMSAPLVDNQGRSTCSASF